MKSSQGVTNCSSILEAFDVTFGWLGQSDESRGVADRNRNIPGNSSGTQSGDGKNISGKGELDGWRRERNPLGHPMNMKAMAHFTDIA